jgi:hypothetical protein
MVIAIIPMLLTLFIAEWVQRDKQHALQLSSKIPTFLRWTIYYTISILIIVYQNNHQTFIYFQF